MISLFDQGSRASKSEINRQRPDRIRARNSPVPIHCSTVIPAKARINTIRHSREGGNPQFPRMREFIVPLPRHPRKTPPPFPRRRESIPAVIPAKAGIHNSRVRGNSSSHSPTPEKHPRKTPRHSNESTTPHHSREGENQYQPSFPRRREFTIPAYAGIHRPTTPTPEKNTPPFQRRRKSIPAVIPAKAGIPQFPRMREFIVSLPRHPRKTPRHSNEDENQYQPSFPRRRESTIPAHAGIHRLPRHPRKTTPTPEKNTPPFPPRRE